MEPLIVRNNNPEYFAPRVNPLPDGLAQGAAYTAQFGSELANSDLSLVAAGNQSNAALMERLYDRRAQTELSRGSAAAASIANQQGGIGGFILGAAQLYTSIQRQEQQKEAAKRRADLLQRAAAYSAAAPVVIQETEEGYIGYNAGAQQLAEEYAAYAGTFDENGNYSIDPAEYVRFVESLYKPAARVLDENSTYRTNTLRQAVTSSNQAYASRIVTANSIVLAQIGQEQNPEKRRQLVDSVYTNIESAVANLPYPAQVAVLQSVLPEVQKSANLAAVEQTKTFQRLTGLQNALTELESVKKQFAEFGNTAQARDWYRAQLTAIDAKNGTDLWSRFNDPTQAQTAINDIERQVQTIREAEEKGAASPAEALSWTRQHMGVKAFELAQDAGALAQFESLFVGDYAKGKSANARAIVQIAKQWQGYREWYTTYRTQINQYNGAITSLNLQSAEDNLRYIQQRGQLPQELASLGIFAQFNQNMKSMYDKLLSLNQQNVASPAEVEAARRLIVDFRTQAASYLNNQITILNQELPQRFGNLGTYGFDPDPTSTTEVMRKNAATLQSVNKALNQSLQMLQQPPSSPAQGQTSQTPNFKPAPQQTANLGLGRLDVEGKSIYVPFPKSATANAAFTSPVGPRGGKFHAGIDIGIPSGTPLVFYDEGEVVTAYGDNQHNGGYGNYITIRTPNGRYHRFAHLSNVSVSVGDRVRPGQVIGKTGGGDSDPGRGTSTGPHLHWEVRTADNYGASGVVSVSEHMNLTYGKSQPRQARNGTLTPKPPGKIQIDQGFISDRSFVNVNTGVAKPIKPVDVIRLSAPTNDPNKIPRDLNANYGYRQLAEKQELRIMFNNAAASIGVPTQWLVDLWAYENGSPDDARIDYRGRATSNLYAPIDSKAMQEYLNNKPNRAIKAGLDNLVSIYKDSYATATPEYFVWHYFQTMEASRRAGKLTPIRESRQRLLSTVDGGMSNRVTTENGVPVTFRHVMDSLGRSTGRRYNHWGMKRSDIRVHTKTVANCPFCAQLSAFINHEVYVGDMIA